MPAVSPCQGRSSLSKGRSVGLPKVGDAPWRPRVQRLVPAFPPCAAQPPAAPVQPPVGCGAARSRPARPLSFSVPSPSPCHARPTCWTQPLAASVPTCGLGAHLCLLSWASGTPGPRRPVAGPFCGLGRTGPACVGCHGGFVPSRRKPPERGLGSGGLSGSRRACGCRASCAGCEDGPAGQLSAQLVLHAGVCPRLLSRALRESVWILSSVSGRRSACSSVLTCSSFGAVSSPSLFQRPVRRRPPPALPTAALSALCAGLTRFRGAFVSHFLLVFNHFLLFFSLLLS